MKKPITVRIEERLLGEARQRARDENRSLTNYIETLLRRGILEPKRNMSVASKAIDENQTNG